MVKPLNSWRLCPWDSWSASHFAARPRPDQVFAGLAGSQYTFKLRKDVIGQRRIEGRRNEQLALEHAQLPSSDGSGERWIEGARALHEQYLSAPLEPCAALSL
ncbi:hypothetical protein [Mitsuaria sp. GD03876]|uniref:hypothetical protein n=1 Tax=Mitsuaria sp. GD03876 TaxID=2975399 RepID=UPI00244BBC98|nr:hypothetical protein [Mitsuaria sp. GD03876]MDH0863978.1 hypothetical protein [Mitsuaria sp. GD03876]